MSNASLMSTLFELTGCLWWLFAAIVVGWWSWRLYAPDKNGSFENPARWRSLYRQALSERDASKLGLRIQQAEGAILLALTTQVFTGNPGDRKALQDAMNELSTLRQTHSMSTDSE